MISVCMAAYNGEKFIKKQIDSILCQLDADDELIISDDGSTDETLRIISSYNDSRIKVLNHVHDESLMNIKRCRSFYLATANFENAMNYAKGDFIFLSDQDDEWLPERKKKSLEKLQDCDCVMCNYNVVDENGQLLIPQIHKNPPFKKNFFYNLTFLPFTGCCMAFKKECLEYILPFPKKLICHDLWIGSLCNKKGKIAFIGEVLHSYRKHETNVSFAVGKKRNPVWFMIYYRIIFIVQFIERIFLQKRAK